MKQVKIGKFYITIFDDGYMNIQKDYNYIAITIDELRELLRECESLIDKENES